MNQDLIKYLTNGGLIKTLGIVVLFVFTLGSGGIVAYDIMTNQPVNPVITTFLGIVLTHVANMFAQMQTTTLVTGALLVNPTQTGQLQGGVNDAQGS
jgi:hypothetical protein